MTGNNLLLALVLSLSPLLTGCGSSPPNNYYVLSAHEFAAPSGEAPAVGVGPIEIPEYLSRENLVYNRVDNSLQIADESLWAEPLTDGVQRVLALNMAGLLNTQSVQFFPWHPKRAPDYGVKINILQLEAGAQDAYLTAEWLVYRPENSESVSRRISRLQVTLAAGSTQPEQITGAYSSLLFQLSEIIAAAVTADQDTRNKASEP
jgi:uncharacterized lipoprotein YmbA